MNALKQDKAIMKYKTITLSTLFAVCPMAASQISSSLTDMAESHNETGERRNKNVLFDEQMDESKKQHKLIPFNEMVAAAEVLGCTELGFNICEYLTYKDFASINATSKAWHAMMVHALENESAEQPLLLPYGIKLIEFTKKLIVRSAKHDEARLSVIKSLTTLCNRSYFPGNNLFHAFKLYEANVPENERVFSDVSRDGIVQLHQSLSDLANIHAELRSVKEELDPVEHELARQATAATNTLLTDPDDDESAEEQFLPMVRNFALREQARLTKLQTALEQQKQFRLDEVKPILAKWQPYGTLLKMATLRTVEQIREIKEIKRGWAGTKGLNLLEAPQISEACPIKNSVNADLFGQSYEAYAQAAQPVPEQIEQLFKRYRSLQNLIATQFPNDEPIPAFSSLNEVKNLGKELVLRVFTMFTNDHAAFMDHTWLDEEKLDKVNSRAVHWLLMLDQITEEEHGLEEMLLHPDEWHAIWREQTYPCMIPAAAIEYLKLILDPTFLDEASSDWMRHSTQLVTAAGHCQEIAHHSTNPTIIKIYTKKAAAYLDNHFELLPDSRSFFGINSDTTSLQNIAWKTAHPEFANLAFYLKAIQTFQNALPIAANAQKKKEYLSMIDRLRKRIKQQPHLNTIA